MTKAGEPADSFVEAVISSLPGVELGADWVIDADSHPVFVSVRPQQSRLPLQGWKLHLSATPQSASSCLNKALPVLISNRCHFKFAKSRQALHRLHETIIQSGKFITVYPQNDAEAVRLAQLLHSATEGCRGPCIRTDRALCRGSIVHYRYGGFRSRYLQDTRGREMHAIEAADGQLVPDRRLGCYSPPRWAIDPFVSAGLIQAWEDRPIFANRFLLVSLLQQGFQSDVLLGIDLDNKSPCLVKRSRDDGVTDMLGGQASLRLAHEATLLKKLAHLPGIPRLVEFFKVEDDTVMVAEWIESVSLDLRVRECLDELSPVPWRTIIQYSSELAATLAGLHSAGFIHGDVKPANILVTKSGQLYVTDFDHAVEILSQSSLRGRGTRGWASPEQFSGSPAALTDDIFGLGATLLFICTGIAAHEQPGLLLDAAQVALTFRQIRPDLPESLLAIIIRCLARDPKRRFQCVAEFQAAISGLSRQAAPPQENATSFPAANPDVICDELYRNMEQEVECVASGGRDSRFFWGEGSERISLDLASGLSGILLVLSITGNELAASAPTHIRSAAKLLVELQKQRPEFRQAGLFTGKAGCALAIAYAGSLLSDEDLLVRANELVDEVASVSVASVDVHSGLSGLILFYLSLFRFTCNAKYLALAEHCGRQIIDSAEPGTRGICWRNENWDSESKDNRYFSYLHGTAGVADALLCLSQVSGKEEFRWAAGEAGMWLAANTFPIQNESLVVWPKTQGEKAAGASQALGAGGIGRFLLHAWQHNLFPQAEELTLRAARTAAAARWLGPSLGYGLAGNIDFLLEVYQYLQESWLLEGVRSLYQSLLRSRDHQFSEFRSFRRDTGVGAPGYLSGYAGVLPVLLRLQDPSKRSVFPVPELMNFSPLMKSEHQMNHAPYYVMPSGQNTVP